MVMSPCRFYDVQRMLSGAESYSPKAKEERAEAIFKGKVFTGLATATCGLLTLSSLVSCVGSPILGAFGVAFWGTGCLLGRDSFIAVCNFEDITSTILNRGTNCCSAAEFVDSLFKNTLVAAPIGTQFLIEILNSPK